MFESLNEICIGFNSFTIRSYINNNHHIYAKFAEIVYQNPYEANLYQNLLPLAWRFLASSGFEDDEYGYFGAAFTNGEEIVIAHRGTNPLIEWDMGSILETLTDIISDAELVVGEEISQYESAINFVYKISASYPNSKIIQVGHSLGGALAELTAIATGSRAISFDAPGIKEVALSTFRSSENWKIENITSYIVADNIVNSYGEHIVDPIEITWVKDHTMSLIARAIEELHKDAIEYCSNSLGKCLRFYDYDYNLAGLMHECELLGA